MASHNRKPKRQRLPARRDRTGIIGGIMEHNAPKLPSKERWALSTSDEAKQPGTVYITVYTKTKQ